MSTPNTLVSQNGAHLVDRDVTPRVSFLRYSSNRLAGLLAGVRDRCILNEHVDAAELFAHPVRRSGYGRFIGYVELNGASVAVGALAACLPRSKSARADELGETVGGETHAAIYRRCLDWLR